MKKTILITVIAGILGFSSLAMSADDAAIQQRVDAVKTEFNLDAQQAERIANILRHAGMDKEELKASRMQHKMERRLTHMKEKLGLSDQQVETLRTLMTEQQAGMKALREQGREAINAVLTPEQVAKMEEMHSKRDGMRHHRGGHGSHKMRKGHHGGAMCDKPE